MKRQISNLLDASIIGGFSRIGWEVRSRLGDFEGPHDLSGRRIVVTGPTAGLGRAASLQLASAGADLVLVGRDESRLDECARTIRSMSDGTVETLIADMSDLQAVARASRALQASDRPLHAVVHNAGALLKSRTLSPQGHEITLATHVLGPFLMTSLLVDRLAVDGGRVITVSSGGMYTAPLVDDPEALDLDTVTYDGTRRYAVAKRMQVTLNEMWSVVRSDVWFAAMHPGWADTPGVRSSLPGFRRIMKPILRTESQGADTISWLSHAPMTVTESGRFWSDREPRPVHRLPSTRRSDTTMRRDALWDWCVTQTREFAG